MTPNKMIALSALLVCVAGCAPKGGDTSATAGAANTVPAVGGQALVKDDESQPNVVKVAVGSKDHTTLVAALTAADLVNSLANAGPFTVFAPTNAAFDKLPKGTVNDLLKPANKANLVNILYHHVTTSALDLESIKASGKLAMVDGTSEAITTKGDDSYIGGAKIVASIRASNGWVHVIDAVLVPTPPKK